MKIQQRPTHFASFFVVVGGQLQPVVVTEQHRETVRIFSIAATETVPFAATVAGIMGKLLAREEKIDLLHLTNAEDVCATLLCQQYYRTPFVYSVRERVEIKQVKHEFTGLHLHFPAEQFIVGDFVLNQQLAASKASYLLDETGDSRLWNSFFCTYAGKYVESIPSINTSYWATQAAEGSRLMRKQEFLQEQGCAHKIVVACEQKRYLSAELEPDFLLIAMGNLTREERRKLLQCADYYVAEEGPPDKLLAAMAAGSIPIAPRKGFATQLIHDEALQATQSTGYLYQEEDWVATLQRAKVDMETRPEWQQALRQRATMRIRDHYSMQAVTPLYDRVYRGFAPVRLPFITEGEQPPAPLV